MSTVRHAAAWTYCVLIALFAAAVIVEVFVAGVGVFGALPGEDKPVSHGAFDDKFAVHAAIGGFLVGCSLLLLIAILIVQAGPLQTGATFGAGGPDGRQGGAGEDAPDAGAFHAVNAVLARRHRCPLRRCRSRHRKSGAS